MYWRESRMIVWVNVECKGMRLSGNVVCFECRVL